MISLELQTIVMFYFDSITNKCFKIIVFEKYNLFILIDGMHHLQRYLSLSHARRRDRRFVVTIQQWLNINNILIER